MTPEFLQHFGLTPEQWQALPFIERVLRREAYDCDVLEVKEDGPPYRNTGKEVDEYLRTCGVDPGNPWCAAFASYHLMQSGAHRLALPGNCASVHAWLNWAQRKGTAHAGPARGRLGLIIESPTTGHLVTVTDVQGANVLTIEGNTNEGGSREGYGVFRRTRGIIQFECFVDVTCLDPRA